MPQICPYCRSAVVPEEGAVVACEGCGTPHHGECFEENGGCTLFGCKFAPPDDPKVMVTAGDVALTAPLSAVPQGFPMAAPTGFGDVNQSAYGFALAPVSDVPPPPPPPPSLSTDVAGAPPFEMTPEPPSVPFESSLQAREPKRKLTYVMLGIFLGSFGVHNFYAGNIWRGLIQLACSVLTVFYASIVIWIWAMVEVCTVDRDASGTPFV